MDAFLAVASKREVREYAGRPIPPDAEQRILEAGRVSGSSQNRQPWRFVVVESPSLRERLAGAVYVAGNVRGAALVVAQRHTAIEWIGRANRKPFDEVVLRL